MVNLRNTFSRQPSAVASHSRDCPPKNWGHIIWREWRNCDDEEYARHLFDLVVDKPTDWRATAILVLLGAMFGAIGSCLIILLQHPEILNIFLIAMGLIACLIGGVLIILELRLARWSLWSFWLVGLSGAISGWLLILMVPANPRTSLLYWEIVAGIAIGATGWVLIMLAIGSGQRSMWGVWLVGLIPARLIVDEAGRLTFWRATLIVNLFSAICGAISGWLLVLLLYPLFLSPALIIWGITLGVAVGVITGLLAMLAIRGGQRFLWGFWLLGFIGTGGGWLRTILNPPVHTGSIYPYALDITLIILGTTLGAVGGLLVMLGFRWARQLSWGSWLFGLIPVNPEANRSGRSIWNSIYFGLVVVLSSGLGVWLTGAMFFGQPNYHFYSFLVGLVGVFIVEFFRKRRRALVTTLLGILVGAPFGLFFGLGLAQLVGMLIIPLDELSTAWVVGLGVGAGAGLLFGRRIGLVGVLMCQVVAMVLVLAAGTNVLLIRWLIGLLLGGTVASVSRMYLPADKLSFVDAYSYRATYLWWIGRPPAAEVEAAVRELAEGDVWPKLLRNLEAFHQQPETVQVLSIYSTRPNWFDHFIWRHALVALGGEALTHLLALARAKKHHLQPTATWLVQSIGHETATRLAGYADHLRCVDCLTCCGPHSIIRVFDVSMLYYGCRICGQSRKFFYCPQGVVAVLDSTWPENQPQRGGLRHKTFSAADSPEIEEGTTEPGLLRVNWLARRGLFDFDRVEIIQATDEDVERLAVQVGNDTDPIRQPRYAQMQCLIAPQCLLSENSLRVLRRTFGQVECGQEVREWVR